MIVKEQFINSCPKELTVHLREHAPETLEEMAKIADQYLEAHGKHYLVLGGTRHLHHWRRMTTRSHQLIQHHCTVTDVMAEGIGLLIVLSGDAICVEGMAMKQEIVNPVCQSQEGKAKTVRLCRETRLVLDV